MKEKKTAIDIAGKMDAWHCKRYIDEKKTHDTMWIEKECPCYEDREPRIFLL